MTTAPTPSPTLGLFKWLVGIVAQVAITIAAVVYVMPRIAPSPYAPTAVIDGRKLGTAYAATLANTYADAWELAAAEVEASKPMGTVMAEMQAKWAAARTEAFTKAVAPEFAKLLPEGSEVKTTEKAHEIGRVWRDFARGLRGK